MIPTNLLGAESDSRHQRPIGGQSYVVGDRRAPLWRKTIPALLKETVVKFGSREAVVFCEHKVRWTYTEFDARVDMLAAGLLGLGLEPGDRIGIWAPNRPEWLLMQFATARVGLILVNINPAYRLFELEYALNQVECKAIVLADKFKSSDYIAMMIALAPEIGHTEPRRLNAHRLPHLRSVVRMGAEKTPGMINFEAVMALGGPAFLARLDSISNDLNPDDAISIQFTSGTTGTPKGATLSHFNMVNNARFVVAAMKFSHQDRLCIPVPLYHCFGMVMGALGCVVQGAAMVLPSEAFDPLTTLRALDRERCTAMYGVPTMFIAMLEHPEFNNFNLSSMRTGCMAGAPCPITYMERAVRQMHMTEVTSGCGMTELSPVSMQSDVDDTIERRVSTVGRVQPHLELKIVDGEGRTVPVGQRGEICVRGYAVMLGYWNDDAKTRSVVDDEGFIHSGDLAVMDEDGYITIAGRVKDMLIRGGENIYPREIEEYLYRHPKIKDVQVFGVPDKRYGEEVCAWIVLKPGEIADEEEIKEFCRGQIAHYKIPRYIRFKTELPMTVTGKPQKFKMRESMVQELGLTNP